MGGGGGGGGVRYTSKYVSIYVQPNYVGTFKIHVKKATDFACEPLSWLHAAMILAR